METELNHPLIAGVSPAVIGRSIGHVAMSSRISPCFLRCDSEGNESQPLPSELTGARQSEGLAYGLALITVSVLIGVWSVLQLPLPRGYNLSLVAVVLAHCALYLAGFQGHYQIGTAADPRGVALRTGLSAAFWFLVAAVASGTPSCGDSAFGPPTQMLASAVAGPYLMLCCAALSDWQECELVHSACRRLTDAERLAVGLSCTALLVSLLRLEAVSWRCRHLVKRGLIGQLPWSDVLVTAALAAILVAIVRMATPAREP